MRETTGVINSWTTADLTITKTLPTNRDQDSAFNDMLDEEQFSVKKDSSADYKRNMNKRLYSSGHHGIQFLYAH